MSKKVEEIIRKLVNDLHFQLEQKAKDKLLSEALLAIQEYYLGKVKDDFEDFLMEQHGKQYIGTDDNMPDDFNKWVQDLGCDELIEYGNKYHADIKKRLTE